MTDVNSSYNATVSLYSPELHDRLRGLTTVASHAVSTPESLDPTNAYPGPKRLLVGDGELGFFGEVTGEELSTCEMLSSKMDEVVGVPPLNDVIWLKFVIDSVITYVAKEPRTNITAWPEG